MSKLSKASREKLQTCHPDLKRIIHDVSNYQNFTVVTGHRDKETQNKLYQQGYSQLQFPESKHNHDPSLAVDVAPYVPGHGIPWKNKEAFAYLGGWILAFAKKSDVQLRWGNDWDRDDVLVNMDSDESFYDPGHFELVGYD